jgi:hypothetical protein
MQFVKGLAALSGTVVALLIATIVFDVLKMPADSPNYPPGTQVGCDIKVLWVWMLYSPIYWLVVLALLGLSVWVFRHWAIQPLTALRRLSLPWANPSLRVGEKSRLHQQYFTSVRCRACELSRLKHRTSWQEFGMEHFAERAPV